MAHRGDPVTSALPSLRARHASAVVIVATCLWSLLAVVSPARATSADVAVVGDAVIAGPISYDYGYSSHVAGPAAGPASPSVDAAAGSVTIAVGDASRPATVTMAWPARTGSWSLEPAGPDPEQHASITRGGNRCTFTSGTITVTAVAADSRGGVAALSADLRGGCALRSAGDKQTASIRIGDSSHPVAMPRATPFAVEAGVVKGSDFRQDVVVTNDGSTSWQISGLGMASANASSPSIAIDPATTTCGAGTVLAVGDQCTVTLQMSSVPTIWLSERLVVLGSGSAALIVPVHLDGHAPVAPPTDVAGHPGRLGTLITWDAPSIPPKEGYRVYDISGGQRSLLVEAPASATEVMLAGTGVRHLAVVAADDAEYAESPDVAVDIEQVVSSEVVAQRGYGTQMVFPTDLPAGNERTTTLKRGAVDATRQRWVGLQSNAVSVCSLADEACSEVPGTRSNSEDTLPQDVVWLPDGRIAYLTGDQARRALWLVTADGSSAPRKVADLPDRANLAATPSSDEVLALDLGSNRSVERIRLSDGRVSPVPNTSGVDAFTASNHGELLLERRIDETSLDGPRRTTAVSLDGSGAHVIPLPSGDNRDATFDPSGTQIAYVRHSSTYEATVWVARADGSSPRQLSDRSGDWFDLQWSVTDEAAPTAAAAGAAFTGTTANLRIVTADPDDSRGSLITECRIDGGAWVGCPADPATYTVSGLTVGHHLLQVRATDASGLRSETANHDWSVDSVAPGSSVTPPAPVQFGGAYRLTWSGSDVGGSGVGTFEVRLRSASVGASLGSYSSPLAWHALTGRTMNVTVARGTEQCWSVRARDRAGNVGTWSGERCTSAVLDDRALAVSPRWKRLRSTSATYGTYSRSTRRGALMQRIGVSARQVGVVATTCPTCGALTVTHAGKTMGRISLRSSTTKTRQVLWLPMQARRRTGILVLKALSAKQVLIDGIVVRH